VNIVQIIGEELMSGWRARQIDLRFRDAASQLADFGASHR
jgi:hypothetical protein